MDPRHQQPPGRVCCPRRRLERWSPVPRPEVPCLARRHQLAHAKPSTRSPVPCSTTSIGPCQALVPKPRALLDDSNSPIIHEMNLPSIAPPPSNSHPPPLHMFHLNELSTTLATSTRGKAHGFLPTQPNFSSTSPSDPYPPNFSPSGWDLPHSFEAISSRPTFATLSTLIIST
jgi:hypothetical protein